MKIGDFTGVFNLRRDEKPYGFSQFRYLRQNLFLGLFCLACDNFSALAFYDEQGEVYAELVTDKKGRSYLSFRGADGLSHELLGIDTDGTLFLAPTDKTGKIIRRKAS